VRTALVLALLPGVLVAQALPEPFGSLVAYGPVGIGVALWLMGYLPSKGELDRANARAEKAESQRDALTEKVLGEILPMIGTINANMLPAAERMAREVRRLSEEVARQGGRVADIERGGRDR
jgi:hypothetical protein